MRHDVAPAHELGELGHGRLGARRAGDHRVVDAGELGDLERHGNERVDQRREALDDLGSAHDGGGHLDDAVAVGVVAGRLDVEHADLVLEAVQGVASARFERLVGGDHVRVRAGDDELFQGGIHDRQRSTRF